MNKRGGDKLISVYWFVMLVIIAGGIVAMVNIFYGSAYDVRIPESEILSRKVADCMVHGGEIDLRLVSNGVFKESFRDNFLDSCDITFEKKGEFDEDEYYIEVNFFKQSNLKTAFWTIMEGNLNWKEDCNFKDKDQEKLVKCSQNKFYAADDKRNLYRVDILSIVRKTEQNVN